MSELLILNLAFISAVISIVLLLRKNINNYLNKKIEEVDLEFEETESNKLKIINTLESLNEEKFRLLRAKDSILEKKIEEFSKVRDFEFSKINNNLEKKINQFKNEIEKSTEIELNKLKNEIIEDLFKELSNLKSKNNDIVNPSYIEGIEENFIQKKD